MPVAPAVRVTPQGSVIAARLAARQPRRVDDFDLVHRRQQPRDLRVPAADHEIDLGVRREAAHCGDRAERHQQIADALQPQQQDPPRRLRRPAGHHAERQGQRAETEVSRANQPALTRVVDLEVIEHAGRSTGRGHAPQLHPVHLNTELPVIVCPRERTRVERGADQPNRGGADVPGRLRGERLGNVEYVGLVGQADGDLAQRRLAEERLEGGRSAPPKAGCRCSSR